MFMPCSSFSCVLFRPKVPIFRSGGTLYEVDLGLHHTTVELDLPAMTDSSDFHLTAFVEWRVVKPAKVVAENIRDVREALSIALRIRLRSVTPEFDVSEVVAAEAVVKEEIKHPDLGRTYGLETTIIPRLTVDERARAYASTQRELERELAIEELRHRNKKREEEHEQQRQRARIAEYRDIVASGNIDQFALQLASNPQDVAEVVKLAREERQRGAQTVHRSRRAAVPIRRRRSLGYRRPSSTGPQMAGGIHETDHS